MSAESWEKQSPNKDSGMLAKEKVRIARHKRIRKRLSSAKDRPRLSVHRSLKNIYLQVIDDQNANTLLSFSTLDKEIRARLGYGGNIAAAGLLGELAAEKLKQKGISKIIFDRGGYVFHGRIKAVADGLRKGGLIF
jgi:large subunit ribosomal protein L18